MGRGRPRKAISHSTAPNEKNQNSSPAHNRCVTVARANAVKNVWVRTPQIGSRKIPTTNFTHFVGTVSGSDCAMYLLDGALATLRTTFWPRLELRALRYFFDLRFVAKSSADYADCGGFGKAKFAFPESTGRWPVVSGSLPATYKPRWLRIRGTSRQAAEMNRLAACAPQNIALRSAHVSTGPGVDLDRLAFLDEKRNVNRLAGFKLCRLGDVAGRIATKAFC